MRKRFSRAMMLVLVLSLTGGAWANLVGHWKLDEGSGTTAKDASGNGNDGTLQGAPVWGAGVLGRALQFSGSNSVNCGPATKLALPQTVSITLWVNPGDLTGDHAFAGRSAANIGYAFKSFGNHLRFTTPGVRDHDGANSILKVNTWQHVAVVMTASKTGGCVFYINGVATDTLDSSAIPAGAGTFEIGHNHWAQWCMGMIDDVRVYDQALTQPEIMKAMKGEGPELAIEPSPADKATDVPADVALAWTPGKFAATHDVYLGTSFADVNSGSRTTPAGVLASQDQADARYDPDGLLAYGQTYYWRIDEVNGAPDKTVFKGSVWSFTVEPYSYPLAGVKATALTYQPSMGPEKTVDGSGLTGDLHGTESTTMWMSTGTLPNWIQYEFNAVYKLDKLVVWNSNQIIEAFIGFGAKDVTIEYSVDGAAWTALADVPQFVKAPGAPGYAASNTVNFGGAAAKYVKLTINKNWSGIATQTGLAEVRFFSVPVQARAPLPANGATGVSLGADLSWRPGREATSHKVYFGTDSNAVANGAVAAQTVANHSYTPSSMNLGTTYYWKVDEVGGAGPYAGNVWSFTTQAYAVVDDFEAYNDDSNRIYDAWIDGLTDTAKGGSQVGYDAAPFAEKTIIHGGKQSMPLAYNNTGKTLSEAQLTLNQDWTASGIKSLSLYFRGKAGNKGQLYVKINNVKVAYDGAAGDSATASWLPWNIDLSKVATTLGKVKSLTIGVEGAGAAGILYIDDVRLYPKAPEFVVPVQPSAAGLVARYTFEGNLKDSVGSHHGTAFGDAKVATDAVRGQVLATDGNGDFVDIPYGADLNPPAFTVGLWAMPTTGGSGHRSPITSRGDTPQRGYILYVEPGNTWQFWTGTGTGWNTTAGPAAQLDEWVYVTATFAGDQKMLYLNGRLVGQSTAVLSPNTQWPVRIGGGATESTAGNYFFRGPIDDVCLYNRALSPEEVAGLAGRTQLLHKAF